MPTSQVGVAKVRRGCVTLQDVRSSATVGQNALGNKIRSLRKRARLTQEGLAEGICSPVSISRIENGHQMPSRTVLDALLKRLGTNTYQICNVYYQSERQLAFEQAALKANGMLLRGQIDAAEKVLFSLREDSKSSPQSEQTFLLLDADIALRRGDDAQGAYDQLVRALHLTQPSLNLDEFRGMQLSPREANVIDVMVVALNKLGKPAEASRIGEELLRSMDAHASESQLHALVQIDLCINLSHCMDAQQRFTEALYYARRGRELCLNGTEQVLLPDILFLVACQQERVGQRDEAASAVRALLPYLELVGRADLARKVSEFACVQLGM